MSKLTSKTLKVVVSVGIAGVGKSTVLNYAKKFLEESGFLVEVLNFGDYMFNYLVKTGLIRSRDDIRKLPLSKQREIQSLVAKDIREYIESLIAKHGNREIIVFIDTHALIKTPSGYWPGLPEYVIKELKPDMIAVVEASPEEILARQTKDVSRVRSDYSNLKLIDELMKLIRMFAVVSASFVGASLNIIYNEEGKAEEAGRALAEAVKRL